MGHRDGLELIAPETLVVDVLLGDERRGELILEDAGRDLDDLAVVVGRAGGEGLTRRSPASDT